MKRFQSHFIEIATAIFFLCLLVLQLGPLLITGKTIFLHDIFHWYYPLFQYFAENIIQGRYPLWNPFSHAGEPFYTHVVSLKMLDPILLAVIFFGKFLTHDLVKLFNWNYFIQILIMLLGTYLFLRRFTISLFTRLSLIPILLYSGLFLSPFRSNSIVDLFQWVPFISIFLYRIIFDGDYRWRNWLLIAVFTGLYWQAYRFVGVWIFYLFFFIGVALFHREKLKTVARSTNWKIKLAIMGVIIFGMMGPDLILLLDQGKFVLPVRMVNGDPSKLSKLGQSMSLQEGPNSRNTGTVSIAYSDIEATGTFARVLDFILMPSPIGKGHFAWPMHIPPAEGASFPTRYVFFSHEGWGPTCEVNLYIGLLPWLIFLFGVFFGQHAHRRLWLLILVAFALFSMGPPGGLHRILYYFYPPARFDRHVYAYLPFFLLPALYFYVLGMEYILVAWNRALLPLPNPSGPLTKAGHGFSSSAEINRSAILRLALAIIVAAVIATKLSFPWIRGMFLVGLAVFGFAWWLRNDLGRRGLFLATTFSWVSLVIFVSQEPIATVAHLLLFLGLPLLVLQYIRAYQPRWGKSLLLILYFVGISADLLLFLKMGDFVYRGQARPDVVCRTDSTAKPIHLPDIRRGAPLECDSATGQGVRYLELMNRTSFALSSSSQVSSQNFEDVLPTNRWNCFLFFKNYFELLHSGFPVNSLKQIFTVDEPMIQFKRAPFFIEDGTMAKDLEQKHFDLPILLRDQVLIEKKYASLFSESNNDRAIDSDSSFSYIWKWNSYNDLEVNAEVPNQGVLYWADGYDKAWRATVNGREISIARANFNFKAIAIPKGHAFVHFWYDPKPVKFSLVLFYLLLSSSLLGAICLRK